MVEKILGIVLQVRSYSDELSIAELITQEHGRMSVLIPRGNTKKGRALKPHFYPLSVVTLVVSTRTPGTLSKIKEASSLFTLYTIPYDPRKSAIAFFLADILRNALRNEPADPTLFQFLCHSIAWLDESQHSYANFHLVFLVQLARILGICPKIAYPGRGYYFDLSNGEFTRTRPIKDYYYPPEYTYYIIRFLRTTYATMSGISLTGKSRTQCAEAILQYYKVHIPEFGEVKSLEILKELFE